MNIEVYGLYEHKVRELDSLILLKLFLKKYSYNMAIRDVCFTKYEGKVKYSPKILILPYLHGYNESEYILNKPDYLINMHWEQVGSKNSQGFFLKNNPNDDYIKHVSWSSFFTNLLIEKGGISRKNIWQIGNPKADLLSEKFIKTYLKEDLIKKSFGMNERDNYIVFIMGFSSAFVTEKYIENIENKGGYINYREYIEITKRSFYKSMDIIKILAKKLQNKNLKILLRPHPMTPLNVVRRLFKGYKNVKISRDFPLHEVVYYSKGVISFNSTSVVDAHIFSKPIYILRPYKIPSDFDIELFEAFKIISNANELYEAIINNNSNYNKEKIEEYIGMIYGSLEGKNTQKLSYKIKNLLEKNNEKKIKNNISLSKYIKNYINYFTKGFPKIYLPKLLIKTNPNRFKELEGRLGDQYRKNEEKFLLKKYSKIINDLEE